MLYDAPGPLLIRAGGTWTSTGVTGGTWLHLLGFVGDVQMKTAWPGGFLTVSWRMALPTGFSHPAIARGSLVEVFDSGGTRLGYGRMSDPDRAGWTFVADGMAIKLRKCLALDASNMPTTNITTAVTQAAARGWYVFPGSGLPSTSLSSMSETNAQVNTLPALLDEYCRTTGKRWWVDPDGYLHIEDEPTTPTLLLVPGVPAMATADDDALSFVAVRHVLTATGATPDTWGVETATDATAVDLAELYEDETSLGILSGSAAEDNAEAILAANANRPHFSQAVEVGWYQVTTLGGTPVFLPEIRGGVRVKHLGIDEADTGLAAGMEPEWVIGGTDYASGARVITLTPVDVAERTLAQLHKGIALREKASFA